jgi:hypothetical protein
MGRFWEGVGELNDILVKFSFYVSCTVDRVGLRGSFGGLPIREKAGWEGVSGENWKRDQESVMDAVRRWRGAKFMNRGEGRVARG